MWYASRLAALGFLVTCLNSCVLDKIEEDLYTPTDQLSIDMDVYTVIDQNCVALTVDIYDHSKNSVYDMSSSDRLTATLDGRSLNLAIRQSSWNLPYLEAEYATYISECLANVPAGSVARVDLYRNYGKKNHDALDSNVTVPDRPVIAAPLAGATYSRATDMLHIEWQAVSVVDLVTVEMRCSGVCYCVPTSYVLARDLPSTSNYFDVPAGKFSESCSAPTVVQEVRLELTRKGTPSPSFHPSSTVNAATMSESVGVNAAP